jgi:hypothetical protein
MYSIKSYVPYTGWSKRLCAPDDYSTQQSLHNWWVEDGPSQNTFGMWTVVYWTWCSRTQFGVSINVWRLAGAILNITCNFLYCNHQVHRDFLITLYKIHQDARSKCYCFSVFHRAFFSSIMDKTPTHALFTQHYISLACRFH